MSDKKLSRYLDYLNIITKHTGYDFSGYSLEPLTKRLEHFISQECITSTDELSDRFSNDAISYDEIAGTLNMNSTELFPDPDFFSCLRTNVFPFLGNIPEIKILLAGCASGEEVYSLAILLDEAHLLERCKIFATDSNRVNISKASRGIYSLQRIKEAGARYFRSGGNSHLSKYYTAYYDHIIFQSRIRKQITFIHHDLPDTHNTQTFHLVLFRNVFAYFNAHLQKAAVQNLAQQLINSGYIGTGNLHGFHEFKTNGLVIIDEANQIYRKEESL